MNNFSKFYHWVYKYFQIILTLISPELNTCFNFYRTFNRKIDLQNPTIGDEKIQWLKLKSYIKDPLVWKCVDKYRVREYITDCGCPEILNEIYGYYEAPEAIEWNKLPNRFAIKSNYGSGMNIICTDKSRFDKDKAIREIKKWKSVYQHLQYSELQYAQTPRCIICEKFIENENGEFPEDYKVYCFNGVPKYVMICEGRFTNNHKFLYCDTEANYVPLSTDTILLIMDGKKYIKPDGWDDLIKYAAIVSKPFPFVRADFYLLRGKVLFGELTFTPCGGLDSAKLKATQQIFGDLIQLPEEISHS